MAAETDSLIETLAGDRRDERAKALGDECNDAHRRLSPTHSTVIVSIEAGDYWRHRSTQRTAR